jgi:5-(carboxyamino)imidazole ribonucleotide mutase
MTKKVGIIMGSDSDLDVMQEAAKILDEFKVEYEITVVSAHRTPERMFEYAKTAYERGLKVIIAGAGGAAHLPGMVASITTLPVIGVPVKLKTMDGLDSLLSIVQMPGGVPVATVAINNAKNAGLLAVQILATHSDHLHKEMQNYKDKMKEEVERKAAIVEQGRKSIGFKN